MFQIPLWLYMAAMAAGTGAQYMGQKKVDDERAKAMREERERRERMTRENEATADKSKQLFAGPQADEAARAAAMTQQIAPDAHQITTSPEGQARLLDPNSPPSATSTVDPARAMFDASNARSADRAAAMAKAGAFGSVFQNYGAALGRNAQDIDMNATSMRNWNQNVLPARLEYANQSGRDWSTAGDILKLAGTIMAPFALGGGAGAGNATQQIQTARFGDFARQAFGGGSVPFGSNFGMDALGMAGSMGAGIAADPRVQELLSLQRMGHRLSLDDLEYLKTHNAPGMMH